MVARQLFDNNTLLGMLKGRYGERKVQGDWVEEDKDMPTEQWNERRYYRRIV
jgi:hypothetical protein